MNKILSSVESSLYTAQNEIKLIWIVNLTILTALSAQVEIPLKPVPLTFQTFIVFIGAGLLGKKNSSISQLLYLTLGALGVPLFAGFSFGLAKLLGPSGGYLFGFVFASFVIAWMLEKNKSFVWIFFSLLCGSLIIFFTGIVQLNLVYLHDWSTAIKVGFIDFVLWDLLKITIASTILYKLSSFKNKAEI